MSIAARCRCGKKFQVKTSAAGKKFKCTECGEVVKVPEEQLDELEDFDEDEDEADDFDDGEIKMPVRRKKKKSSKAASMAKGIALQAAKDAPAALIRISGIVLGILGAFTTVVGFLLSLICFGSSFPAAILAMVLTVMCYLGTKAALGLGLKVSHENVWQGTGSIFVGNILVVVSTIFIWSLLGVMLIGALHAGRREMRQQNWEPPPNLRRF